MRIYVKLVLWFISIRFICEVYLYFGQVFPRIVSFSSAEYEGKTAVNCSEFGFGYPSSNDILIYDFFIFNNELDLLEIRLYELYDYVNLFLIAESNRTLSGKAKPFYLKDNWARFSRYHDKIHRIEVSLSDLVNSSKDTWHNEDQMRDEGIRLSLPNSTRDFLLLTSDVDEIPKSRFVRALKSCQLPQPFPPTLLQCDFYYYSFEFLQSSSPLWPGGTLSRFSPNENVPTGLRGARSSYHPIRGVCFHCSFCFDTVASVRLKLNSFSHTEYDHEGYHKSRYIIGRFRNGRDLFDRSFKPFRRSQMNETELPRLLQQSEGQQRFMYMLKRSSMANVGFRDFNTSI